MEVEAREQGVVVEHLLEVRNQPARVGRVTMKATAELIVDAALSHLATGMADNVECLLITGPIVSVQEKLKTHRRWKLGRAAKTAVSRIVTLDGAAKRSIEEFGR